MLLTAKKTIIVLAVCLGLLVPSGCGDDPKKKSTRGAGGEKKSRSSSNLKKVGQPSPELHSSAAASNKKKKKKKKRKKQGSGLDNLPKPDDFAERDFMENEQESRDPFRNYLIKAPIKETVPLTIGDTVYLKNYPVAELRLTGIVGSRKRFAMIKDPRTGRTTILKKRDIIAKERARIYEINRDHLVLLIPRIKAGKKKIVERTTLYVDDSRKIVDIGSDTLRPDESGIRFSSSRRRGRRPPKSKEP
jgi:Tfp pilus assembly protein PilP